MDIEEIKDFVYEVRTFGITSNDTKFVQITEYLLSELEKEKEKNKRLEKFIENGEYTWKQKYNETFEYFKEELEKEKEKNKSLLQCLKDSQERCENEHLFLGNPDM